MTETTIRAPRLRWVTMNDHWRTTTVEGWAYRVRYSDGRFVTERESELEVWAFVWVCRTLAQAKFAAFSDVRRRRWEATALAASTTTAAPGTAGGRDA